MKKIKIKNFDEEILYEKLENGIDVYLFKNDNIKNTYVTFTTKFGSINKEFVPIGKKKPITIHNGIAHFLEHKVFAQETGIDPATFFAQNGVDYNAHTSLKNTTYEIMGTNNLIKNLNFLLDYVQAPYFTDKNVLKEQGIIEQEILMYKDRPWSVLYDKIRENTFINNPIRFSIAGEVLDIKAITKEELYDCYNTFYNPSNMFIVVTGSFDTNEVINAIKDNQKKKDFKKSPLIKPKKYKEPDNVKVKNEIYYMPTDIPKVAINYKISLKKLEKYERRTIILYLYIIFMACFDETSLFDEKAKKDGIITDPIFVDILDADSHVLISLINVSKNYEEIIKRVDEVIKNIKITEQDIERKKRVLISNEIFAYDDITTINDMIIDNIIYDNKINDKIFDNINSLNKKDLDEILQQISFDNVSTIVIKNED